MSSESEEPGFLLPYSPPQHPPSPVHLTAAYQQSLPPSQVEEEYLDGTVPPPGQVGTTVTEGTTTVNLGPAALVDLPHHHSTIFSLEMRPVPRSRLEAQLQEHCAAWFRSMAATQEDDAASDSPEATNTILLLTGPPGSGKTTLAESLGPWIRDQWGGSLLSIPCGEKGLPARIISPEPQQQQHPKEASSVAPEHCTTTTTNHPSTIVENQARVYWEALHDLVQQHQPLLSSITSTELADLPQHRRPALAPVAPLPRARHGSISLGEEDPGEDSGPGHQKMGMYLRMDDEASQWSRFRHDFCRLLGQASSKDRPVVLLMDDLHQASRPDLDLLVDLLTKASLEGLLVMGTTCPVSMDHALSTTLRALEDEAHLQVLELRLGSLEVNEIEDWICHTLLMNPPYADAEPLSMFLHRQSNGNLFTLMPLVRALVESDAIVPRAEGHGWTWRVDRIQDYESQQSRHDELDLVGHRLRHLSAGMQELLTTAACLGMEFEADLILHAVPALMAARDPASVFAAAESQGLLIRVRKEPETYRFAHPSIWAAAQQLIPEQERANLHFKIGRRLWRAFRSSTLEEQSVVIVGQLRYGKDFLTNEGEKVTLASLCVLAGRRQEKSSCFQEAATTFQMGMDLLPTRAWRDHYDLALALHHAACEAEHAIGHYDRMDELASEILRHARTLEDQMPAYVARINFLGTRSRVQEAIDTGYSVLALLDEPFPTSARVTDLRWDLWTTSRIVSQMSDSQILSLPNIKDKNKLAAIQVMNVLFCLVCTGRPKQVLLLASRMVRISLKYGLSALSACGFAAYGGLLCVSADRFVEAKRYGDIALRIIERFQVREWIPRVHCLVFAMIKSNIVPLREILPELEQAASVGMQSGDTEFVLKALYVKSFLHLFQGAPLAELYKTAEEYRAMMVRFQQDYILTAFLPLLQLISNLRGETEDPLVLSGRYMDEGEALARADAMKNSFSILHILVLKGLLAYLMNDYSLAAAVLHKSAPMERTLVFWLEGSSALQQARQKRISRWSALRTAHRCLRNLKKFAEYGPDNLLHRVYSLEAEIALTKGQTEAGCLLYQKAIQQASSQRMISEHALILEHAGLALCAAGKVYEGVKWLHSAQLLYSRWGAIVKVKQMEALSIQHQTEHIPAVLPQP